MGFHMKTTLDIDDSVNGAVEARSPQTEINDVRSVESALRLLFRTEKSQASSFIVTFFQGAADTWILQIEIRCISPWKGDSVRGRHDLHLAPSLH
jgi:hypothetical protein